MSMILSIASGKGGVGKTLVTAALSVALRRQGYTVLAADADMGLRNLDLMFGLLDSILYDAGDVIKGRCLAQDAVLSVCGGLDFLAASQKHTWEKVDAPAYHYLIETLAKDYDYTVVDCPPGRGQAFKDAIAITDRLVFVVEPTWSSLRDTARVMQFCRKRKRLSYDLILNNVYRSDGGYVSVEDMLSVLDAQSVAGVLPHDKGMHDAAQQGRLVHAGGELPFMKAMAQTASYLASGTPVDMKALTAQLPACELTADGTPLTEAPPAEDGGRGWEAAKAAAAAELQKAAAIMNSFSSDTDGNGRSGGQTPGRTGCLSLRRRREQSAAWRQYRR